MNRLKIHGINYYDLGSYKELGKLTKNYGVRPDDFETKPLKELETKLR